MISRDQFFSYFWPAVTGLLVGLLIFTRMSPGSPDAPGFQLAGQYSSLSSDNSNGYRGAVARAAPSVVRLFTVKTVQQPRNPLFNDPFFRRYFNPLPSEMPEQQTSLGSGIIMTADGYILTNEHVVTDADQILVILEDGRQSNAEVIGYDSETDLAVLKAPLENLPVIPLGDPKNVEVGDIALAIGNPFGIGQTVTQGIISATGRRNFSDLSQIVNFIQTDAAINQGNSGGALIDAFGNLIGINTAVLENDGSVGVGFATPSDVAIKVLNDIVEHGHVIRGWVGISASPVKNLTPEYADMLGITYPSENLRESYPNALIVDQLVTGGPAHSAGLEVDDVLIEINGRSISNIDQVQRQILDTAPGSNLTFTVLRNDQPLQITVQADTRPDNG